MSSKVAAARPQARPGLPKPELGENWIMETGNDARWPRGARVAYVCLSLCVAVAAIATLMALAGSSAFAQEIVASINGDPITNIDIDERMKMLRVLRKTATRDAAIESLFTDRLEIREADKFGVDPKDSDISQQIVTVAQEMKLAPDALVEALQHAGVKAFNKGVEASEEQVRAELAKQGGKAASGTAYTVRQIIFAIPHATTVTTLTERAHEAEQLRARFTDCESGLPLARAINDVTVRDPLTKTAVEIGESLRQLLDKTPAGHLTPPQRSSEGLEMIAVCAKGTAKDDSAARAAISQKILAAHNAADGERRLKELRARAVIVQR